MFPLSSSPFLSGLANTRPPSSRSTAKRRRSEDTDTRSAQDDETAGERYGRSGREAEVEGGVGGGAGGAERGREVSSPGLKVTGVKNLIEEILNHLDPRACLHLVRRPWIGYHCVSPSSLFLLLLSPFIFWFFIVLLLLLVRPELKCLSRSANPGRKEDGAVAEAALLQDDKGEEDE